MRVKISEQPPPAPTTSAVGPCPTVIQIVGRCGTESTLWVPGCFIPETFHPRMFPPRHIGKYSKRGYQKHFIPGCFLADTSANIVNEYISLIKVANTIYECKSVPMVRTNYLSGRVFYSDHLEFKLEIGNNSSVLV